MGKFENDQSGFGSIEVLLCVLILVIVAFGGYYVYHTQKNSNNKPQVTTQSSKHIAQKPPQATSVTNSDELIISEWGVKLTFKDADKVQYQIQSQPQADGSTVANLSLKSSVTTVFDCQDLQVALIRTSTGPASDTVHYVKGYYYHIAGDPAPCSGSNGENSTIDQERTSIIYEVNNASVESQ